jgi:hypothetical protein
MASKGAKLVLVCLLCVLIVTGVVLVVRRVLGR